MTQLEAFRDALVVQEAIVIEQRGEDGAVDVLGRPVTPCCGALDIGDSHHGGRPYQCLHEIEEAVRRG